MRRAPELAETLNPLLAPPPATGDERGAVYTPEPLAAWVAAELTRALPDRVSSIWDIACGEGALLAAVDKAGYAHQLVGIDIDADALDRTRSRLPVAQLICGDALVPGAADPATALASAVGGRPDGIILNPPWGASLALPRDAYHALGYQLAVGQFDSYDLFVELSIALLRPGGIGAFIVPDSLLGTEHLPLRRLLLEQTTLELVARLGEGFFPSIYRGAMVVMIRKRRPAKSHRVRCLRLSASDRKAVLRGLKSLDEVASATSHTTPQAWFKRSAQLRLEVDVRDDERRHLERFEVGDRMPWREMLYSTRGVELSKHGRVVRCPRCEGALPLPRRPRRLDCRICAFVFESADARLDVIVAERPPTSESCWRPLIAGEDVRRYVATPSRSLRVGVPGIAYKTDATFEGPKLLVRKTGVGLSAAVDRSNALTTQVVYIYKPLHASSEDFILDYVAGVLNSRFMLAYHLRTRGEAQWRSHPYVTQQIIESLPVPAPTSERVATAVEIAEAARRHAESGAVDRERELRIEQLVARLYGFDVEDWRWALRVLEDAQSLEGIKELRLKPGATLPSDVAA